MNTNNQVAVFALGLITAALLSGCSEAPKDEAVTETAVVEQTREHLPEQANEAQIESAESAKQVAQAVDSELASGVTAVAEKASEVAEAAEATTVEAEQELEQALNKASNQIEAVVAEVEPLDGKALASSKGCVACHAVTDAKMIGPGWGGLAGSERLFTDGSSAVADSAYLRAAITNPNAQIVEGYMPTMPAMPLSDDEVSALVDYIETLK